MFTIPAANTDTHNIEARYEMRGGADAFEINTKGYTLEEITTDMIEFFNDMGETAVHFSLHNVIDQYDDGSDVRVELKGEFYVEDDDNPRDPNRLESVTVIIDAVEK